MIFNTFETFELANASRKLDYETRMAQDFAKIFNRDFQEVFDSYAASNKDSRLEFYRNHPELAVNAEKRKDVHDLIDKYYAATECWCNIFEKDGQFLTIPMETTIQNLNQVEFDFNEVKCLTSSDYFNLIDIV
ncbi:MAG: hypothetical protein FJ368_05905 [Pelagibacterales bacterium]|nr:hypothetical protein [Pelagibacterales bacterium]